MGSPAPGAGGVSTLMTSAPQSASWRTAVGPARTRVRSSTVKRESGIVGESGMATCQAAVRPPILEPNPARAEAADWGSAQIKTAAQSAAVERAPGPLRGPGFCSAADRLREDDLDAAVLLLAHTR